MSSIENQLTILAVLDVDASRAFFVDKMGFTEELRTGGWSFLRRGALRLRIGHCPGITPISECLDHSLIVQAVVDDARGLYEEFLGQGVEVSAPEDTPWGQREFGGVTPDGHRFMFTQSFRT